MNKELEFKDNKWIVTDESGIQREIEPKKNIKEILETENNIESINELIEANEKIIKKNKSNMSSANTYMSLCFLWGFLCISNALTGSIFSSVCNFLCSAIWGVKAYFFEIRPNRKKINASKKSIVLLNEQLDIENQKLNNLSKEKNTNFNYVDTSKKHLTTSDKIFELINKLMIIEDYQHNKIKYIYYYKKGYLNVHLSNIYNLNNIKFIEQLIENDLKLNKNNKTKEKQKTLTK